MVGYEADLILPRLQHTIQPPQDRKRQNHIPVLVGFEQSAKYIIGYVPDEGGEFLKFGHGSKLEQDSYGIVKLESIVDISKKLLFIGLLLIPLKCSIANVNDQKYTSLSTLRS